MNLLDEDKKRIDKDSLEMLQKMKDEEFENSSSYFESQIKWALKSGHLGCERKYRIKLRNLELEYYGKIITEYKEVYVSKGWNWNN